MLERIRMLSWRTDKGEARTIQHFVNDIGRLLTEDQSQLAQEVHLQIKAKSHEGVLKAYRDRLVNYRVIINRAVGILHHTVVLEQRLTNELNMLIEHLQSAITDQATESQREQVQSYIERLKKLAADGVQRLNAERKKTRDVARSHQRMRDKTLSTEGQLLNMLFSDAKAEKKIVNPIKRRINKMCSTADSLNKHYSDSSIERLDNMFKAVEPYIQRQIALLADAEENLVYLVFDLEGHIRESWSVIENIQDYLRMDYFAQLQKAKDALLADLEEDMKSLYYQEEQARLDMDKVAA